MAHFEVGKKVICIKDHSRGVVKKGQVFTLDGIIRGWCKCNEILLDIGLILSPTLYYLRCFKCGAPSPIITSPTIWFSTSLFAPYDDSLSDTSIEELIESLETIGVPNPETCDATGDAKSK